VKRRRSLESHVHRKMPAWFGGELRGKGPGLPGTSPRGLPGEGLSDRIDLGARLEDLC